MKGNRLRARVDEYQAYVRIQLSQRGIEIIPEVGALGEPAGQDYQLEHL